MTNRTRRSLLNVFEPFVLKAVDGIQPAGPYEIEVDEEQLDSNTRIAFRRTASFIHLERDGTSQVVALDAEELSRLLQTGVLIPVD